MGQAGFAWIVKRATDRTRSSSIFARRPQRRTRRRARTAVASFGLGADAAERPARTLPPGERTRAELAALAQRQATCLVLEEPTNHLDVESLEVLEAALRGWPGALVVATHDLRLREGLKLEREVVLGSRG